MSRFSLKSVFDAQLESINPTTLTPLVRRALGRQTVQVIGWGVQQIHGGSGGGVFASAGQMHYNNASQRHSLSSLQNS